MLAGHLALIAAALFTGAAFYINFAEQPARLALEPRDFLIEWRHSYERAFTMQASLVVIGFLLGLVASWQTGGILWLLGAIIFVLNWPFTLLIIMPINNKLKATDPSLATSESRALLKRWATLHTARTALGFAATLLFLLASVG